MTREIIKVNVDYAQTFYVIFAAALEENAHTSQSKSELQSIVSILHHIQH